MTRRMRVMIKLKLLSLLGKNHNKADVLRRSGLFKKFGERGYWHPDWIPSLPKYISLGDNVTVAADVRFYEHDIIHRMWNEDPLYLGDIVRQYEGEISVGDNTVLGARSIILAGVHIGHNVVVGCGSVVTRDLPDYSVAVGCPAKVVGDTRMLFLKRVNSGDDSGGLTYEDYFEKV